MTSKSVYEIWWCSSKHHQVYPKVYVYEPGRGQMRAFRRKSKSFHCNCHWWKNEALLRYRLVSKDISVAVQFGNVVTAKYLFRRQLIEIRYTSVISMIDKLSSCYIKTITTWMIADVLKGDWAQNGSSRQLLYAKWFDIDRRLFAKRLWIIIPVPFSLCLVVMKMVAGSGNQASTMIMR